jgi:hypothetical protein
MDMGKAPQFIDEIVAVPGAAQYVKEISYHRYRLTGGLNSLKEIAERAKQLNAATVMNEWWAAGNSYRTLHQDLKIGNNSAWQQAAVGGKNGYTTIDPKTQSVSLTARTKFMLPYYKNIKPGAKRIEATTTASKLDPISFINRDGKYVVIIKAESAGTVSIRNLPPAVYGISYTTLAQFDKRAADVTVLGGRDLEASIPSSGVLSVYSK